MAQSAAWYAVVLGVLVAVPPVRAAAPPLPAGTLRPEDTARIARLERLFSAHALAGRFEDAGQAARQILQIRWRRLGRRHPQTMDAGFEVNRFERLEKARGADRLRVAAALKKLAEGRFLTSQGRHRAAVKEYRECLAIFRQVFGEQHADTANAYNTLAHALQDEDRHSEALPHYRQALAISRKVLGEEHPLTAYSQAGVASCLLELGRVDEALPRYRQALAIARKVFGEEHRSTASFCNDVAACLKRQGKHAEAVPLYRQALEVWTKVLGERHPHTVNCSTRLADCLYALADYAQALALYEKALVIRRQVSGEAHPDTAHCCSAAADCLRELGKYDDAVPLYRKALAIRRKVRGEEHPDTGVSYNNLAMCLKDQGKDDEAVEQSRKSLAIMRKARGEEHPETAAARNNLALCLNALGRHDEALSLSRKALADLRKVRGEEHPDTAAAYDNLARCLTAQGSYADALVLIQKALAIRRKVLGEEHLHTATAWNQLAGCLHSQGKDAEALPLFRQALAIWEKKLGEEHPQTASGYSNLGACLSNQGKHAQALPLLEKALLLHHKLLGAAHSSTIHSSGNLAGCLYAQGLHAEALPLLEKVLARSRQALGEDHPDTISAYDNLASCLGQLRRYDEAEALHRKALAISRKVLGEKHRSTATVCNQLASCLHDQDKPAEALPFYQRALEINRQVLGESHPRTALAYQNLANCLNALGRYAEALPLFRKALAIQLDELGEGHLATALTRSNLALCLARQGKDAEAAACWRAALLGHDAGRLDAHVTGFDRASFRAAFVSPRLALAVHLARRGEALEAWQHAEADLARGLLDDLDPVDHSRPDDRLARLGQLDALLLPLLTAEKLSLPEKTRRAALEGERRQLRTSLARQAADRAARLVFPLRRIQKQIPADAALVFWLDAGGEYWGCVVRRQGQPLWQRLPGRGPRESWTEEDLRLPGRVYQALRDPAAPAGRQRLVEALARQWLGPLEPHLKAGGDLPAVRRLLVVPTGLMARAPVEALTDRYAVSYVPSGTVFAHLMERHRALGDGPLLAVGDPVFDPPTHRLPDPPDHGVLLSAVLPGGSAARAGLRAGDVLLRVGEWRLESVDDLTRATASLPAPARYWRDGRQQATRLVGGPLGVVADPRSARAAVRAWRRNDLPVRGAHRYQPLPGTRLEAQALARLVPTASVLLGSRASEQNLAQLARSGKLRGFRLLHLATHGEVDARPRQSALILAQDRLPTSPGEQLQDSLGGRKPLDGRLTVGTVLEDWKLDADLVVLSACESGLGKPGGGDGLLGFAPALLARGARTVVLSRWKVDDAATALLMTRFYENLLGRRPGLKGPLPRGEALAEARKWLRELPRRDAGSLLARLAGGQLRGTIDDPLPEGKGGKLPPAARPFEAPYYWAAFVLAGDPF